ncbi:hypothetical protein SESBI_41273 [Sesbania bispinosa]|nr:hypothetical protein SESBI_41273 [Sesbania bispinosa]
MRLGARNVMENPSVYIPIKELWVNSLGLKGAPHLFDKGAVPQSMQRGFRMVIAKRASL